MQLNPCRKLGNEDEVWPLHADIYYRTDAPVFAMVIAGLAAYAASEPGSVPSVANNANLYQGNMELSTEPSSTPSLR